MTVWLLGDNGGGGGGGDGGGGGAGGGGGGGGGGGDAVVVVKRRGWHGGDEAAHMGGLAKGVARQTVRMQKAMAMMMMMMMMMMMARWQWYNEIDHDDNVICCPKLSLQALHPSPRAPSRCSTRVRASGFPSGLLFAGILQRGLCRV